MAQEKTRQAAKKAPAGFRENTVAVPHDRIAQLAYEKWCQRGRPLGTAQEDWLAAEAELRAAKDLTPSASER